MKHLGFASIAALKQYLRYADARKLETKPILQSLGLLENLDQSAEGRIRGDQFQQFLVELVSLAKDPVMGLASSLYVQTHSYSLLGTISEQSNTLGEAIERIPLFERLVGDMGQTQVERSTQRWSLSWHCLYPDPLVKPHMVDNVLASWTLYARWLTSSHAKPLAVRLQRPTPDKNLIAQYERVFDAPVHFEQAQNSIDIAVQDLNLPLTTESRFGASLLEGKARSELHQIKIEDETFSERISRSIRAHLQLGIANKTWIAQEHNLSERNLQRLLAKEGSSYRQLIDEARETRALDFLKRTELNATEIAHNLGYKDERCFYRSMKRWRGVSPDEMRKVLRGRK